MHYFQRVFEILKQASSLGQARSETGVTLIGRATHVAPDAWIHTVFPPLDSGDVNLLEQEIGRCFPETFREFLELSNGLNVFCDSLAIFGRRTQFDRAVAAVEPYSIVSINLYERPANLADHMLLIGSYSAGSGAFLYVDPKSNVVYRCSRADATPQSRWGNFGEMLYSEVLRLSSVFDKQGLYNSELFAL